MKKFIFGLSLLLVLISISCNYQDKDIKEFFKKKGYDKSDELTRAQFEEMVEFLLTKTMDSERAEKFGFRPYIKDVCRDIPETFKRADIYNYITEDLILSVMYQKIDDTYPDEQAEQIKIELYKTIQAKKAENKDDL